MAWTAIEVVGESPLQVAHPAEYLGPAAYDRSNVLQFFATGGYVTAWRAAHIVMSSIYKDHRISGSNLARMAVGSTSSFGMQPRRRRCTATSVRKLGFGSNSAYPLFLCLIGGAAHNAY